MVTSAPEGLVRPEVSSTAALLPSPGCSSPTLRLPRQRSVVPAPSRPGRAPQPRGGGARAPAGREVVSTQGMEGPKVSGQ